MTNLMSGSAPVEERGVERTFSLGRAARGVTLLELQAGRA